MLHHRLVQIVCGWVAFCHLALGLGGLFASAPTMAWMIRTFYAAEVEIDPAMFYIVKLVSAYYLAFGLLSATLAIRPRQYLALLPIVIAFFAIRIVELVYFSQIVGEALQVPDNRIAEKVISFAIITLILGYSGSRLRSTGPAGSHAAV